MSEAPTPFLQLALSLAIMIAAAKAGGYASYLLHQPTVFGELLVGILLGPTALNLLHFPYFNDEHLPEVIHQLAEIGVLLLMFLAGLELRLEDLIKSGRVSSFAGTLGVVVPLLMGAAVAYAFTGGVEAALFMGLILAATSVSISAQTLMELGRLRTRVGISLLGAAVFDDILVVLGLSIYTAVVLSTTQAGLGSVLLILARMLLFLGIGATAGFLLLPRWSRRVEDLPISQGLIAFTVIVILVYGWAAEIFGNMAAITGAFLAGLVLSGSPLKEKMEHGISILAYSIFVPIFFINIGLSTDLKTLAGESFWFFLALTVVAILGKVIGAGSGGLLGGLSRIESLQLGVGMISRGEVGLIVASVGISAGLIDQDIFSTIVGVVIVTTLLTPPLLRLTFQKPVNKRLADVGDT